MTFVQRQLEELHILKCSLVGGEFLTFIPPNDPDALQWQALLENYPDHSEDSPNTFPLSQCRFQVRVDGSHILFEVTLPPEYGSPNMTQEKWRNNLSSMISIRGDETARSEQEVWQKIITKATFELQGDTEYVQKISNLSRKNEISQLQMVLSFARYPAYELICTHLLPRLHEHQRDTPNIVVVPINDNPDETLYHALITSHHLISPTKRRNLQAWASQFCISGFAKVGYPGVIYCEGSKGDVEEFVGNVKRMQWLALKVRFTEPVPEGMPVQAPRSGNERRWFDYEKVGEVIQEMGRLNREKYVVEMGIGSTGGTGSTSKS